MKNLAKALSLFQGDIKPIPKDSENPFFHSAYSSLTSCWETIRPLLVKHELCVSQLTSRAEDGTLILRTVLLHASGDFLESFYPVYSKDNSPQAMGSSMSYARRYCLQAILGLSTADDDANEAQGTPDTRKAFNAAERPHTPIKTTNEGGWTGPTEKQIARLMAIANKSKWSETDIKDYLSQIGLKSRSQLNRLQYDTLCNMMEAYPKIKEEKE